MLTTVLVAPHGSGPVVAAGETVLYVAGNNDPVPAGDRAVVETIEADGITVVVVDDDAVTASDAGGVDGIVISSSVVPNTVGDTFRTTATPVVVFEPFLFSDMAMTRTGGSNRGEVAGKSAINIVRPDHPLAAGLSGTVAVTSSSVGLSWGRVVGGGTKVATVPGAGARATAFVYEAGAQMHNLVAPGIRIGLFPSHASGVLLSDDGKSLIAAAVAHAVDTGGSGPANEAPTVDAGVDQTLIAPSSTALVGTTVSGTVGDDGLPVDPGAVTLQWSGPAGVTFASPTSAISDVSVSGVGAYTLTLTADDGERATSDSLVLTVREDDPEPDNDAPVVDAGADITVVEGAAIQVSGSASDDGLPDPPATLSTTWSGPAGVSFASPSALTTAVSVPGPGIYSLSLTGDDGELTAMDSLTLVVDGDPPDGELDIMFVAVSGNGASAEQNAIQRLRDGGHTVTVVDDNVADHADAAAFDLVIVSASIAPNTFDDPWGNVATPIVVWEPLVFDELDVVVGNSKSGFLSSQRDIRILDSTHPITQGYSGLVRVTSSGRSIAWTQPEGDGRVLASTKSNVDKAAIFTYEAGVAMHDGTAPARRVGLFLAANSPQVMTDDGWTLFDRAIEWASQMPTSAPVADAAADVTSGVAPVSAVFDASASTGSIVGYHWDFGDGTTATGITAGRTFADGGSFDVTLTVTDDEGRTDADTIRIEIDPPAPGGGHLDPIASYDFVQGAGSDYVHDVSGYGVPLDLRIHDTSNVTWLPGGGLSVDSATKLESDAAAEKITGAVKATEEITIEAWVDPINTTQTGPARIVALTNGDEEENDANAMLAQGYKSREGDRVEARFMTSATTDHGQPGVLSRDAALDGDLVHLVFTRSYLGVERIYVDGSLSTEWNVSGDTSEWDLTTPLVLANERGGNRPWRGVFHRVQVYDRAIGADEVCATLAEGPGRSIAGNDAPSPCLVATGALGFDAPHTVQFDSGGSVDLDGSVVSRSWSFGDGASSAAVAPSHAYDQPGDYDVTLTVTDNNGASRSATYTVVIGDPVPAPAPTLFEASGMRVGNGFFKLDPHTAREAWLGRELNWTAQFTSHRSASEMGSSSNGLFASRNAQLPLVVDRMNVTVSVGLAFGDQDLKNGGAPAVRANLIQTLRGDYDFLYYRAAARMWDAGYGDATIRLGHEFNAKWPPWAGEGNEALFIQAYRHVADLFRNVSPDFQFDWSAFKMRWATSAPAMYPGDDYVDIVSMSVYWKNKNGGNPWRETKWDEEYRQNLDAMRDFAIAHGKPIGIAEWGIQNLDEPLFLQRMYEFFQTLPASGPGHLAYNVYWDSGEATSRLDNLPAVKERYKQLFS